MSGYISISSNSPYEILYNQRLLLISFYHRQLISTGIQVLLGMPLVAKLKIRWNIALVGTVNFQQFFTEQDAKTFSSD